MVEQRAFWRGKRVLITGHTGFKGGWLTLWLNSLGAFVVGYSLPPPSSPNFYSEVGVADGIASITGDIRQADELQRAVQRYQPEIIFHLAAQALVRPSYASPVETYTTNVLGTIHVLEAARLAGTVRVVINVTSDKCYENKETRVAYCEGDPKGGRDPYSSSKGCAELVAAAYFSSFFQGTTTGLASVRAGNVIGGGDWADERLVPDFVRAIVRGQRLRLRSPQAVRPWQHVLEPLNGYLLLAEKLWNDHQLSGGWNFGPSPDDARTVLWLANRLVENWESSVSCEIESGPKPYEAEYLTINSTKAHSQLNWRPVWQVDQAVKATTDWYRAWQCGQPMREFTLDQIERYQDDAR